MRAFRKAPLAILSAMKRVAAPEMRKSRVSRQGLASCIKGSISGPAWLDFTCQPQLT